MKSDCSGQPVVLFYNFTAAVSGAEIILLDLLQGISKFNREHPAQAYHLVLVCPDKGPLWERAKGVVGLELVAIRPLQVGYSRNPITLLRFAGQMLRVAWDLVKLVRRYKPVMLHANAVRAGVIACMIAPFMRTSVLVHLHDKIGSGVINQGVRLILGLLAWRLVAISNYTNQAFTQGSRRLLHKCVTIYNGVDVHKFNPTYFERDIARDTLLAEWPSSNLIWPLLGIVGQITPWKGHQTILEALKLLVKTHQTAPQAGLIIVGGLKFAHNTARYDNATFYQELKTFIEAHELQKHIWFCGERSDIPRLMLALDALLLPSWYEPFGRVVIEAMAMERVVVASREGGPLEIIEDNINGYLFPIKDAEALANCIERVIAEPTKAQQVGRQARVRVLQKFTSETMVNNFLQLYNEAKIRK